MVEEEKGRRVKEEGLMRGGRMKGGFRREETKMERNREEDGSDILGGHGGGMSMPVGVEIGRAHV